MYFLNVFFADRHILDQLEDERILVYTPSRQINGKRVTCYDDRFILRLAEETDGIIVSNDHFRDLQNEKSEWKELVEKRLLMFSFVSDRLVLYFLDFLKESCGFFLFSILSFCKG